MKIFNWRPFPIVLLGFVQGPVRYDGPHGDSYSYLTNQWFLNKLAGHYYQVTHIQYRSKFGFLLYWPLCFHIWFQFKQQTPGVSGSEFVIYRRIGARWEASTGTYQIPSIYFNLSTHWD